MGYYETEKIKQLIALGSIAGLASEIGKQHDFNDRSDNQTTFYHRDRREEWEYVKPFHFATQDRLLEAAADCGCEYVYLFDGRKWRYAERGEQYFGLSDGSPFSAFQPLPATFDDKQDEHRQGRCPACVSNMPLIIPERRNPCTAFIGYR